MDCSIIKKGKVKGENGLETNRLKFESSLDTKYWVLRSYHDTPVLGFL